MKRGRKKPQSKDEFSQEEKTFINFLATPEEERGTQRDLADELDVAPKTLSQWKKRKDIWEAVYDKTLDELQARLPRILNAIADKAEEGSLKHAEMVLELTGKIMNKGNMSGGNAVQVNINTSIPRNEEEVVEVEGGDT